MMGLMDTTLLTTREVARLLGLSVPTITHRARTGALPYAVKAPGRRGAYLFDARVVAFVATRPSVHQVGARFGMQAHEVRAYAGPIDLPAHDDEPLPLDAAAPLVHALFTGQDAGWEEQAQRPPVLHTTPDTVGPRFRCFCGAEHITGACLNFGPDAGSEDL